MYLGALPDIIAVFGIFFNDGQNAGSDDAMRLAEIAIDFLQSERDGLFQFLQFFCERQATLRRLPRHIGGGPDEFEKSFFLFLQMKLEARVAGRVGRMQLRGIPSGRSFIRGGTSHWSSPPTFPLLDPSSTSIFHLDPLQPVQRISRESFGRQCGELR